MTKKEQNMIALKQVKQNIKAIRVVQRVWIKEEIWKPHAKKNKLNNNLLGGHIQLGAVMNVNTAIILEESKESLKPLLFRHRI